MSAVRSAADAYENITIVNKKMIPDTTKHLFITTLLENFVYVDKALFQGSIALFALTY
jgi:hypothetical protein